MSQHLPLRTARPLHRQCVLQRATAARRPFSATTAPRKSLRQKVTPAAAAARTAELMMGSPSPAVQKAQIQKQMGTTRDDFGALAGTFVREWGAAPPLLPAGGLTLKETLGKRWTYEKTYFKTKFMDLYRLLYYKFFLRKSSLRDKPKGVFVHTEAKRLAKDAYVAVYEALASKSTTKLESVAISTFVKHITKRIASRPANVDLSWQLVRHLSAPRVLSNRFTIFPFPGADDSRAPCAFRQLVVRLKTRQRLTIERNDPQVHSHLSSTTKGRKALAWSPDGPQRLPAANEAEAAEAEAAETQTETEPIEKDVTEYMLLQRRMWKGVEEPWKVWGFVDKTTLESIEKSAKQEQEILEFESRNEGLAS